MTTHMIAKHLIAPSSGKHTLFCTCGHKVSDTTEQRAMRRYNPHFVRNYFGVVRSSAALDAAIAHH